MNSNSYDDSKNYSLESDSQNISSIEYKNWIVDLKFRIRQSQIKAAVKVNTELLKLYWQMGNEIVEKQKESHWGDGFLKRLSNDLMSEFSDMKGFEVRNLRRIRQWFLTYSQVDTIRTQAVSELQEAFFSIPWGHHILIMQRCKELDKSFFYIYQTLENNWSRNILEWQIESGLYERQGSKISNFSKVLPDAQSELANQIIKDPYNKELMNYEPRI